MKVKWLVWTDAPRNEEPPEACDSLEEVFEFLKKFEHECGFNVPIQVIMLKRLVFKK